MYQKARVFGDQLSAETIMASTDPKDMKTAGRLVVGFNQDIWDCVSLSVMKTANLYKYLHNKELRIELFRTAGSILVEASKGDKLWGVGMDIDDPNISSPSMWQGKNQLGYILSSIRDHLMTMDEYKDDIRESQKKKVDLRASLPIFNYDTDV